MWVPRCHPLDKSLGCQRRAGSSYHQSCLGGFVPFLDKVSAVNLRVIFSLSILMRGK